jgi:hypothetical protein
MGRPAIEGDSPLCERRRSPSRYPSTTGHEKPGGNLGGPSSKAKYYESTDSERVPRGKGEKNPGEGSEIESETVCLQAVGALCPQGNALPRTFCIMGLRVIVRGKVKPQGGAGAKASPNRATSRVR